MSLLCFGLEECQFDSIIRMFALMNKFNFYAQMGVTIEMGVPDNVLEGGPYKENVMHSFTFHTPHPRSTIIFIDQDFEEMHQSNG